MLHKSNFFYLWIAMVLVMLSSCRGVDIVQRHAARSTCTPQTMVKYASRELPAPIHEVKVDSALLQRFSKTSLNIAYAIGQLENLSTYIRLMENYEKHPTIENRMELLVLSQKITEKINLASLEISSVASELDCEEERVTQIAEFMKGLEEETDTRLTVASIVVGAASTVISGVMLLKGTGGNAGDYLGIASGVVEASLGISVLANKRKVDYYHKRNALREIWANQDTSEVFPPFVWYYLNYFNPANPESQSMRYRIIERWISFKQIEDANTKKRRKLLELYFGDGGRYSTEQLFNRASMYDQVESQIKLIKQDLTLLNVEFDSMK